MANMLRSVGQEWLQLIWSAWLLLAERVHAHAGDFLPVCMSLLSTAGDGEHVSTIYNSGQTIFRNSKGGGDALEAVSSYSHQFAYPCLPDWGACLYAASCWEWGLVFPKIDPKQGILLGF